MRRHESKPVVLVTGCNSGIGNALARLLYERDDYTTIITARAMSYEHLLEQFPERLVAQRWGFVTRPLLTFETAEKADPNLRELFTA